MTTSFALFARLALMTAALVAGGCTGLSTVQVESELEKLRFYSNMHVVQAGDTLDTVAFRYRLDPSELAALNPGVADSGLRAGMRINVRPGTELAEHVRQGARLAAGPPLVSRQQRVQTAAAPASTALPRSAPAPAPPADPAPPAPTTVIATAPAREAERLANQAPEATTIEGVRDMVIREARWQSSASAHPREEVIPDDLGPMPEPLEPLAGYTPVPMPAREPAPAAGPARGDGAWVWPTEGQIARGFAPERVDGQGIDIAGLPGQDVRAAAAGTVIYSGKSLTGSGGNLVILRHDDGLMTTYAHADKLFVTEDDAVRAGDPIASLGANEAAESVLSFEVRRAGQPAPLDPLRFVSP